MKDILTLFLKIGFLGFGGPVATMAMMEREAVSQKKWISREEFNQAFTLCKLLPGPAASQMAIYLGTKMKGKLGGLLTGLAYIVPGCLLSFLLSYLYFNYGAQLSFDAIFYGINPVVVAIILDSLIRMSKPYFEPLKSLNTHLKPLSLLVISYIGMLLFPSYEFAWIILCGLLGLSLAWNKKSATFFDISPLIIICLLSLKAGTLFFGGGFAIVALMQHPLVNTYHWLTQKEFLDAIAVGLMTPGPMSSSFVFFGYKVGGWLGAIVAPMAFFLPSFIFIYLAMPWMKRISNISWLKIFVDGAIIAILGSIVAVTWPLARHSIVDIFTVGIFGISFMLLIFKNVPTWSLILAGGILGIASQYI